VRIKFITGNAPDRIDIKYNENFVFSSGTLLLPGRFPSCKSDGFIFTLPDQSNPLKTNINYSATISNEIIIYVYGGCGDEKTRWSFTSDCF